MSDERTDAGFEASDGDLQEQRRNPMEDAFDPERITEASEPDGSSTEADPADMQDQSVEVPEDDDRATG